MGAQKVKGKFMAPGLIQGSAEIRALETVLTSAQVKALRATPITVVPAPGAGKSLELVSALLQLNYGGTNAFTGPQNVQVKYKDGASAAVSQAVTGTGFIDQTADMVTSALPKTDAIATRTVAENQPLVLHNTGAAEITGNAANDNLLHVKVLYRVHNLG
jgi:hypothetical protein